MRQNAMLALLAAVTALCFSGWSAAGKAGAGEPEQTLKIAFVYIAPVGNAGWSYAHDLARRKLAEDPRNVTSFEENVPDGKEGEAHIRRLSEEGNDLIITTSFTFMDPTIAAAADHPKVRYLHCSGYKTAENVSNFFGRMYQARFLSGMAAGGMTQSNRIGYVAAFPLPEVVRGLNAFTLGVRAVNPKAEVHVIWTKTWFDPELERTTAERLIREGADVIAQHQDSSAPQEAAQAAGIYSVGYNTDMSRFAPDAHLVAAVWNWAPYYEGELAKMRAGTWQPTSVLLGMETGIVDISDFGPMVPGTLRKRIEDRKMQIINGSYTVFKGPVIDRDGRVRIVRGKVPSDKELVDMDWYVQGVVLAAE